MSDVAKKLVDLEAFESELAEVNTDPTTPLPEHVRVTRGHNRSRVLQVRLNADEMEMLELFAKTRGVPVSTVARSLILASLAPSGDAAAAFNRIDSELESLRRRVLGQA